MQPTEETTEPAAERDTEASIEERQMLLGHHLGALVQFALTISIDDVKLALDREHRKDTTMPIFDPTRYRAEMANISRMQRVLAAFLTFRLVLEEERAK